MGPETNKRPEVSCFKKTTRFPAKRPARMIRTVPGVMDSLNLVCRGAALRTVRREGTSSAGYQRGAFSVTVRLPPLKSLTMEVGAASCFLAGDFHSVGFLANLPRLPNMALREERGTPGMSSWFLGAAVFLVILSSHGKKAPC